MRQSSWWWEVTHWELAMVVGQLKDFRVEGQMVGQGLTAHRRSYRVERHNNWLRMRTRLQLRCYDCAGCNNNNLSIYFTLFNILKFFAKQI